MHVKITLLDKIKNQKHNKNKIENILYINTYNLFRLTAADPN